MDPFNTRAKVSGYDVRATTGASPAPLVTTIGDHTCCDFSCVDAATTLCLPMSIAVDESNNLIVTDQWYGSATRFDRTWVGTRVLEPFAPDPPYAFIPDGEGGAYFSGVLSLWHQTGSDTPAA